MINLRNMHTYLGQHLMQYILYHKMVESCQLVKWCLKSRPIFIKNRTEKSHVFGSLQISIALYLDTSQIVYRQGLNQGTSEQGIPQNNRL